MKKPSPHVLPPSCGLFLYGLWMLLCCAFRPADPASIEITLVPSTTGTVTLSIITYQKTYANIRLEWQVIQNGLPGRKGILPGLLLSPSHPTLARLPIKSSPGNEETWLRVTARSPSTSRSPAPPTTVFLVLRPWHGDLAIPPTGELTFTDSNNVFAVTSPNTSIQFDKQTGWLLHYEARHLPPPPARPDTAVFLTDTACLTPVLWPAITPHLQLFSTSTGSQLVIVKAEYTIPEVGCLLHLSYTINAAGAMLIGEVLEADTTQHFPDSLKIPPLTRFGWRCRLPPGLDSLAWLGATDPISPPNVSKMPLDTPVKDSREAAQRYVRWLNFGNHDGTGWRVTADSTLLETLTTVAIDSNSHTSRATIDLHQTDDTPSTRNRKFFFKIAPAPPPPPSHPSLPRVRKLAH